MRIFTFVFLLMLINCSKEQIVYAPAGISVEETDLQKSRDRAKKLNEVERRLIQEWMKSHPEKYYPTSLGYWINKEDFDKRIPPQNDQKISYSYTISDFEGVIPYNIPKGFREIPRNRVTDLKAVHNALQKMKVGEEVQLLVPSAVAYGAKGDGDKIASDIPLIINLKIIESHEK